MNKAQIIDWLQAVKDPEIPTISLIDLGVVRTVEVDEATGTVSSSSSVSRRTINSSSRSCGIAADLAVNAAARELFSF